MVRGEYTDRDEKNPEHCQEHFVQEGMLADLHKRYPISIESGELLFVLDPFSKLRQNFLILGQFLEECELRRRLCRGICGRRIRRLERRLWFVVKDLLLGLLFVHFLCESLARSGKSRFPRERILLRLEEKFLFRVQREPRLNVGRKAA